MGFFSILPPNPLGTPPAPGANLVLPDSQPGGSPTNSGPWRPPQWGKKQLTSLTANLPSGGGNASGVTGAASASTPTTYFFDAVLRVEHSQELRCTEHPIQSGASIVDHAYLVPTRITMEIGMSDVMPSLVAGQFTSDASKSISAYKTMKQLQALRVPIALSTRLDQYKNMVIEEVRAVDDKNTAHGLRMLVVLRQIVLATVATVTSSARPDQSGVTDEGTKSPTNVPPGVQDLINSTTPTTNPFHH